MNTTPTVVDLTGLPEPVVRSICQLVAELKQTVPVEPPLTAVRAPLVGRFAHMKVGPSFAKEMFDEAKREAWAGFPRGFPPPDES